MDARQTKLFLLLQTEQYNAALTLIDSDEDPNHHAYEKAYTLYRLQRESDARDVLETIKKERGEGDRGIVHLEAQLVRSSLPSPIFTALMPLPCSIIEKGPIKLLLTFITSYWIPRNL